MTGGIMIAAAAYLWKRWRQKEGAEAAVMLFALVFLYPILAGGSMEKIWLGYLATLLLSAPIPSRRFVNWGHKNWNHTAASQPSSRTPTTTFTAGQAGPEKRHNPNPLNNRGPCSHPLITRR